LRDVGVDYDDVTETLERQGVQKFTDSWVTLEQQVGGRLRAAAR